MFTPTRAVRSLIGLSFLLSATVDAADLLDIGIVFPRENETYEPADYFPIIFGLQNADKAASLNLDIDYFIRNGTENREAFGHSKHDLTDADFTTEPYIVYDWRKVDTEGHFQVFGSVSWRVCDESGAEVVMARNSSNLSVHFDIKRGAQEIDIPTVTAAKDNCSEWSGVVLNVTGQTSRTPDTGEVCPVIVAPSSTATANPCRVEIGTAAAASMSDALHAS
ncbi:hypothetical protein F5X68DRAFT_232256 [Plectosphaerella plurivora]|uniref:DUF7136 domain-containing protein n=1 Tax=Plectosphaerella plurivora TaxID=936078 RepID=A0A9P9AAU0_9PEZI|nr:hypothetical protein F5X68DRAFT_232256 [Plectosphaerella plurivora]